MNARTHQVRLKATAIKLPFTLEELQAEWRNHDAELARQAGRLGGVWRGGLIPVVRKSFRLPVPMAVALKALAAAAGTPQADLVRAALEDYLPGAIDRSGLRETIETLAAKYEEGM